MPVQPGLFLAAGDGPADAVPGLAVALGIGLLIGAERERRKTDTGARSPAGIRTFATVALMGGTAAAIGGSWALLVGGMFVGAAVLLAYALSDREDPGLTTEAALVLTYMLGALAHDQTALASGIAVVVAALLASRAALHRLVRDLMTPEELQDLLILGGAALVVLPLLPDESLGPGDSLNPFKVWQFAVLVMGVGGVGHVVTRAFSARYGLALAGLAGGFVSSAATIGSMAGAARRGPELRWAAVAGALFSTIATFLQLAVVLAAGSREVLGAAAAPLALGGATAAVVGGLALFGTQPGESGVAVSRRAFDVRAAVAFAALVAGMTFAGAAAHAWLGGGGITVAAALGGFADAHAAAASVVALAAAGKIEPSEAVVPVLLGLSTNTLTKLAAARASGSWRFAGPVWAGLLLVLLATWLGLLVPFAP